MDNNTATQTNTQPSAIDKAQEVNKQTVENSINKTVEEIKEETGETNTTFDPTKADLGVPEEVQNPNQTTEEKKVFDPNTVDFGDGSETKEEETEDKQEEELNGEYEGYSLDEFKDVMDLSDPEDEKLVREKLKAYREAGFTQAQVNQVINDMVELYRQDAQEAYEKELEEEKLYTPEAILDRLKKELTTEEKREYKHVANWFSQIGKGAIKDQHISDALSNPSLVKILTVLYKNSTNTNVVRDTGDTTPKSSSISPQAVFERWQEWIKGQKNVTRDASRNYIKQFENLISSDDKETFNQIFKSILK